MAFRPITDSRNKQYEREIRNSLAIGVHVRRGDFVRMNIALDESYYHKVMTLLLEQLPEATYFVFSDDLEWCKKNRKELGFLGSKTVFVEGNYDYKNNYIDIQLMSYCNVLVEGRSSFSYLAGLLNQTPGFKAIQLRKPPIDDMAGSLKRVVLKYD